MTNSIPKININTIEFLTSNLEQIQGINDFINEWNSDSLEIELQTSGSTGFPKKIIHKKIHFLASAKKTGEFFNFNSDQKLLLCLSIHTIGGKMQLIRALFWKMPLIVVEIR